MPGDRDKAHDAFQQQQQAAAAQHFQQQPAASPWHTANRQEGSIKDQLELFQSGVARKSTRELQEEEARRKREREQADEERVLKEYVATFDEGSGSAGRERERKTYDRSARSAEQDTRERERSERDRHARDRDYDRDRHVRSRDNDRDRRETDRDYDRDRRKRDRNYDGDRDNDRDLRGRDRGDEQREKEQHPKSTTDTASKLKKASSTQAPRKRNMDAFLEELKRDHNDPEASERRRQRMDASAPHAFYEGHAKHIEPSLEDVNIFVTPLHSSLNETSLCETFGVFGPIASVKVMWPRTPAEFAKGNNSGFISFMRRKDAERAFRAMNDQDLMGYRLRITWGKPVPIPAEPIYLHPSIADDYFSGRWAAEESASAMDVFAESDQKNTTQETIRPFNAQRVRSQVLGETHERWEVRVSITDDLRVIRLIHRTIERVLVHGPDFEALLMEYEQANPVYAFLFDIHSSEHVYYRWKLYSLSQGDTPLRWRTRPFQMFDERPPIWWVPPSLPFEEPLSGDEQDQNEELYNWDSSSEDEDADDDERKDEDKLQRQFRNMIRVVALDRRSIGGAMAFALDHPRMADVVGRKGGETVSLATVTSSDIVQLVDILIQSMLSPLVPVFPSKIARLYVINDILFNSVKQSAPLAERYKSLLEEKLLPVFDHLNVQYRAIEARLKAEQMKAVVVGVLEAWEGWSAFAPVFIQWMKAAFLRSDDQPGFFGESGMRAMALPPNVAIALPSAQLPFDNVAGLVSTSGQQANDDERKLLREIEVKVANYQRELQERAKSSRGGYAERMTPAQIAAKTQEFREQLLREAKK